MLVTSISDSDCHWYVHSNNPHIALLRMLTKVFGEVIMSKMVTFSINLFIHYFNHDFSRSKNSFPLLRLYSQPINMWSHMLSVTCKTHILYEQNLGTLLTFKGSTAWLKFFQALSKSPCLNLWLLALRSLNTHTFIINCPCLESLSLLCIFSSVLSVSPVQALVKTVHNFFFFCVPIYISGVHHFGWDFCVCDCF